MGITRSSKRSNPSLAQHKYPPCSGANTNLICMRRELPAAYEYLLKFFAGSLCVHWSYLKKGNQHFLVSRVPMQNNILKLEMFRCAFNTAAVMFFVIVVFLARGFHFFHSFPLGLALILNLCSLRALPDFVPLKFCPVVMQIKFVRIWVVTERK